MQCRRQVTARYANRKKHPPYEALHCIGRKRFGNDGQLYESRLKENGTARWYLVKSVQCSARKANGRRCSNKTSSTFPCCWIHTVHAKRGSSKCAGRQLLENPAKIVGLRIKQSTIAGAGKGLYAARDFAKDEVIAVYTGRRLTADRFNAMYPGDVVAPYAYKLEWCDANNQELLRYIDAKSKFSGVTRYANDCCKDKYGPRGGLTAQCRRCMNSVLIPMQFKQANGTHIAYPTLIAKKDIKSGKEIFLPYGKEYWQ